LKNPTTTGYSPLNAARDTRQRQSGGFANCRERLAQAHSMGRSAQFQDTWLLRLRRWTRH
ncbi:MAG: hypothetical protein ACO3TX_02820, partial [Pseudomonadales bacterium]